MDTVPYGYCQCGCGQKTAISKKTDRSNGRVKGQSARFIRGHKPRAHPYQSREEFRGRYAAMLPEGVEPGTCFCGCGWTTGLSAETRPERFLYEGEPLRFSRGHSFEKRWHGFIETAEYNSHRGMLERCYNPNHSHYKHYGARGIIVCDRWRHSFKNFYADMGDKPGPDYSLDRIDNDGPYSPENCRWATSRQQGTNKSNSRSLTYDGKTMPMSEWSREAGIHIMTLYHRLERGWSVEQALTTPPGKRRV